MKKLALATVLLALPFAVFAQEGQPEPKAETPKVSVKAKGDDVRTVLATIFEQAHKQYVLPANFRFAMFLNLENQEYPKALAIVCQQTGLVAQEVDGIVHVKVAPKPVVAPPAPAPIPAAPVIAKPVPTPTPKPAPLTPAVYAKKITTRLNKADIRDVFASLAEQTGVPIEVDAAVPDYRIDAFLIKTSLRYALDRITTAGKLKYAITDHGTIAISKKD